MLNKNIKTLATDILDSTNNSLGCLDYYPPRCDIAKRMDEITAKYNAEIKKAQTVTEQLHIIGETVQDYEQLHPFSDANNRTLVNILLIYSLLSIGLPPVTFFEANLFDFYERSVKIITKGIENTTAIYLGEKNLFEFNTNTELADLQEKFLEKLPERLKSC